MRVVAPNTCLRSLWEKDQCVLSSFGHVSFPIKSHLQSTHTRLDSQMHLSGLFPVIVILNHLTSFRYGLSKEEAESYVLCDTIGSTVDRKWRTEGFRVVGDNEKPLLLQSLWKPREGLARRFEIQRRSWVEERTSRDKDTITAGTAGLLPLTSGPHHILTLHHRPPCRRTVWLKRTEWRKVWSCVF